MTDIITITIKDGDDEFVHSVEGDYWTQDDDGCRYVYRELDDDSNECVAEVASGFNKVVISKEPS